MVFVCFEIYDNVKCVLNKVCEVLFMEMSIWIIVVKLEEVNRNIVMVVCIIDRVIWML